MKTVVLLLILPQLFCAACDSTGTDPARFTGVLWEWVESVDPDQGGTVYKPSASSAGHTFLFGDDGTFVEDYPGGCCTYEGTWTLGGDGSRLTLSYTDERRAGDRVEYSILDLTTGVLRITIRGRHGMVVETYHRSTEYKNRP